MHKFYDEAEVEWQGSCVGRLLMKGLGNLGHRIQWKSCPGVTADHVTSSCKLVAFQAEFKTFLIFPDTVCKLVLIQVCSDHPSEYTCVALLYKDQHMSNLWL